MNFASTNSFPLGTENISLNQAIAEADVYHKFHVNSYLTPTYCDYCSLLLFGLIKQGLKCEICGQNFHKRCIQEMPKICNKQLNHALKQYGTKEANMNLNLDNPQFNVALNTKAIEIEHTFFKKQLFDSFKHTLKCDHCELKFTHEKYFMQCKDCKINVHAKCTRSIVKNCKSPSIDDDSQAQLGDDETTAMNIDDTAAHSLTNDLHRMSLDQPQHFNNNNNHNNNYEQGSTDDLNDQADNLSTADNSIITSNNNNNNEQQQKEMEKSNFSPIKHGQFRQGPRSNRKRNHIALQRISQRVKKTNGFFWSGHMVYYTNQNPEFATHYWKLDSQSIKIYDTYRLERKLADVHLANIEKASLCGINSNDDYINDQKCLFILRTSEMVFYCGMGNTDQNNTMNQLARNFYNIFKMVYLPYGHRHGNRFSLKITAPKYEEKNLKDEYLINPQDQLGSGQFGQVYGGICKATKQQVAIKVIDKTRFKDFQAETSIFQNEITILYNIQHPGIVKLFALFDEVDHLYIVTEKMATDMLEMILKKQPSRLTERVAKFLIYQILIALRKLHDRNIAHCDLKPENILLTENVEFPQVKICDFGYAKIIGENSFRRSMVGTPAYSPPELKQKRLYNNSIDMWSMGVIIYVSLSGTFPFEEDRDIYEQIMNPNFMYPPDPWDSISRDATDLINQFLQVKIDRRMSVGRALQHRWFSEDYQLYMDLLNLESKANLKWLTTQEQEEKWSHSVHL